jgi:hypothetical protein
MSSGKETTVVLPFFLASSMGLTVLKTGPTLPFLKNSEFGTS